MAELRRPEATQGRADEVPARPKLRRPQVRKSLRFVSESLHCSLLHINEPKRSIPLGQFLEGAEAGGSEGTVFSTSMPKSRDGGYDSRSRVQE